MATTIQKRLTEVVWYGPNLALSTAFANKARVSGIRRINDAGAGAVSWQNGRAVNSLTTLETGKSYTFDCNGVTAGTSSTYFSLDNGTAPVDSTTLTLTFPANASGYPFPTIQVPQAGTYALPTTATGLTGLAYTKNGQAVSGAVAFAASDLLVVTGTTGSTAGTLILIKQ